MDGLIIRTVKYVFLISLAEASLATPKTLYGSLADDAVDAEA